MRHSFLALAVLLAGMCASAQETPVWKTQCGTPTGQPKFPLYSYQELPPFVQADPAEWKGVKGLQVSWADKNVRYAKTSVPLSKGVKNLTLKGWRGEDTLEGLMGPNGELSDIQQAFIDETAVQCGFCTPGFIMSAVEILESGKLYTRDELRKLLSGHLCRCTGYENILNAVEKTMKKRLGVTY